MTIDREKELDRDCDFTFVIMHAGWECDDKGWVMHDGSVFTTNHGSVCEMSVAEIEEKISETEKYQALEGHRQMCDRVRGETDE